MTTATPSRAIHQVEWQTVALIAAMWVGFGLVTYFWRELTWWLAAPLGAFLVCLNGSLQHEAVHGHPTRSALLNEALLYLPIGLLFPYRRYRSMHLTHHNNDHLTDPGKDPESYYFDPQAWQFASSIAKLVFTINNTFTGRMIIGPTLTAVRFLRCEIKSIVGGDAVIRRVWLWHLAGVAIVWFWITQVCGMAFWHYVVFMAYWGLALTLMRSYAEHRAHDEASCRTIIVESNPLVSLMLLNNNLHMAHHEKPAMAWYKLPAYYHANREKLLEDNCGYLIKGYWRLATRYAFVPKEPVKHPLPQSLKH